MTHDSENLLNLVTAFETQTEHALLKTSVKFAQKRLKNLSGKKASIVERTKKLISLGTEPSEDIEQPHEELQRIYKDLIELGLEQTRVNNAIGDAQLSGKMEDSFDSLRNERNSLEEKVMDLRQKRDELEEKVNKLTQGLGAEPMGSMDSPWDQYGVGAADDGKI